MVSGLHARFDQNGGRVQINKLHFALREAGGQQLAVLLL
jgi:hypothetical protein